MCFRLQGVSDTETGGTECGVKHLLNKLSGLANTELIKNISIISQPRAVINSPPLSHLCFSLCEVKMTAVIKASESDTSGNDGDTRVL